MKFGTMENSDCTILLLATKQGEATSKGLHMVMLSSNIGEMTVECSETKKRFIIDWRDFVSMAIERGILKPWTKKELAEQSKGDNSHE